MGLNIFKSKKKKREEALLAMYEKGQYLRVDSDVDNKQLILEGEAKEPVTEKPLERVIESPVVEEIKPPVSEINSMPIGELNFDGSEDIFG